VANYSISNSLAGSQQNLSSGYKSLTIVTASSSVEARRFKIYGLMLGTNGTPADNELEWDVSRQTAAGTATSATPNPLDPADAACAAAGAVNATAEGTVTAASSVFYFGMNQRASYYWAALPGGELVAPATNLAGFTLRAKSTGYTGTATGQIWFQEL